MFHVPTAVKVNFQDYETKLKNSCDFIKIATFTSDDNEKIRRVKQSKKGLILTDTRKQECYEEAPNDDFVIFLRILIWRFQKKSITTEIKKSFLN